MLRLFFVGGHGRRVHAVADVIAIIGAPDFADREIPFALSGSCASTPAFGIFTAVEGAVNNDGNVPVLDVFHKRLTVRSLCRFALLVLDRSVGMLVGLEADCHEVASSYQVYGLDTGIHFRPLLRYVIDDL